MMKITLALALLSCLILCSQASPMTQRLGSLNNFENTKTMNTMEALRQRRIAKMAAAEELTSCDYLDILSCSGEIMQVMIIKLEIKHKMLIMIILQDYADCADAGSVADQIACIQDAVSDGCKGCVCEILPFLC